MKIGIAYHKDISNWTTAELIKAIKDEGEEPVPFQVQEVTADIPDNFSIGKQLEPLNDLNAIILRTYGFGTTDQLTYRISLFEHLENAGIPVINSTHAFRKAKDKYAALFTLSKAGIPVPKTRVTENLDAAIEFLDHVKSVIIKPLLGSRGYGIIKTDNKDLAYRALKFIFSLGQVLYLQEYIEKPDRDIRAFVIGDEVIGAMYRYSTNWKTNVSQGAKPVGCKLSEELEEIAIKSAHAIGLDYTGIDIIEGKDGPYVIETNAAPSWHGLEEAIGENVSRKIIRYVRAKARK